MKQEEQLRAIKHVALDMDGTIYQGATLFPYTIPFLKTLKELEIGYSFLTNNPSKSQEDYLAKLAALGISATKEQLYTSAHATIEFLRNHFPSVKRIFTLGTPSMQQEFERAGFILTEDSSDDIPEAVVVGFDLTLSYDRLCRASWWVSQGKPYIATNPDKVCPTDQPTILVDCASICAAITTATGRNPDRVLGKPDPNMLTGILSREKIAPSQLAMWVGDRLYTDIALAENANCVGILVYSGECTPQDYEKVYPKPDCLTYPSIKEFGEDLRRVRTTMAKTL